MFIIELSGQIVTVNKAMCRELGYSEKELLSMKIWDLIPEEELEQYREKLTKILEGRSSGDAAEYAVRGKDGTLHYVEVLSAPHYTGGDIVGFYGIARDLTERKQAHEALHESQRLLDSMFTTAMDAIVTMDQEQTIIGFNPAAEAMFGCAASEAAGRPLERFLPEFVRPDHGEYVRTFGQSDASRRSMRTPTLQLTCLRANGEAFASEVSISHMEIDGKTIFTAIVRDVTERMHAQQALAASEERFRALVENAPDAITLIGADGTVVYDSPAAPGLLGYDAGELIGRDTFAIVHPDDLPQVTSLFEQAKREPSAPVKGLFRLQHKDGSWRWIEATASNMLAEPGVKAIVINYRDVTERKEAGSRNRTSGEVPVRESEPCPAAQPGRRGSLCQRRRLIRS